MNITEFEGRDEKGCKMDVDSVDHVEKSRMVHVDQYKKAAGRHQPVEKGSRSTS